ncbi:hypothetical protein D0864_05545 [Hortaea werneckii]|uniref:Uncharacterized protein n=1 Tax=Hortaea werneckii TaxID=91943 RepID=A0A3M7G0M5_HORWE|nr:hypothetical protein D0864_05545 [Hortaea werneckii]
MFEDDCTELQSKLPARSASYGHKKHPFSSESEHSQYNNESRPLSSSTLFSRPKIFHREVSLYRGRIVPTTFAKSTSDPKLFQIGLAFTDMNSPKKLAASDYLRQRFNEDRPRLPASHTTMTLGIQGTGATLQALGGPQA